MAKYKTLKSVAHNFGYSFVSLMNYGQNDYALGNIQKQMLLTKLNKLKIDVLNKTSEPTELLTKDIQDSIDNYLKWFPKLVEQSKSDLKFIKEAELTIEFDLEKSRTSPSAPKFTENPFKCISRIVDDRGKEYKYEFNDWWFPESLAIFKPNPFKRIIAWLFKYK